METIEVYALEIHKQRNITKAARALKITQPALSSALLSLENRLGFVLFDRKTSPLATTPEGEAYFSYLFRKQQLEQKLQAEVEAIRQKSGPRLAVGAPSIYLSAYVLPCVGELLRRFPETQLRMTEGTVPSLAEKVIRGELDVIISTTGKLSDQFRLYPLASETVYLCSAAEIPLRADGLPDFASLSDSVFIMLGEAQPLQIRVNRFLQAIDFRPRRIMEVDQVRDALKLCGMGCGLCFAASSALRDLGDPLALRTVKMPDAFFKRFLYLATLPDADLDPVRAEFIQILKKHGGNEHEKAD
jgi:DNA-binding transcriptional LysR family regulator